LSYVLNPTFSISRFEVIAFQVIDVQTSLNRMSITARYRINLALLYRILQTQIWTFR